MAAAPNPISMVPSRCIRGTGRATLAFKIDGYSLHKGLGRGKSLRSAAFSVGGYKWCIQYYPDGSKDWDCEGYVSVFIKLLSKTAEVRALYTLKLVRPRTGVSVVVTSRTAPVLFHRVSNHSGCWGSRRFMKKTALKELVYVREDCLLIECDLEVIKETLEVQLPASSWSGNLAKLLVEKKGADVAFSVQGELFSAHKIVLAMRSPVFDAEFYGPVEDQGRQDITVEDMQPAVFKAFLHFIYTDSMPSMDHLDDDQKREMVKQLLVAAHKYAIELMKMLCEARLCKNLDVENLASILALADQHHCSKLKDSCIEFMLSSNRMDDVVASQGYVNLKRSSPGVILDAFERAAKSVVKETLEVQLPLSSLSDNLAKLLVEKKGADVAFSVQGEVFSAHKIVLAMRSPVFDVEFFGPMGDNGRQDIIFEDMQPAVFKAFLHFIYTDSMPSMDDLDDDEKREMVKHLLVAADKYAMEPMKMVCEGMLRKSLDVENLASILALADQHHCNKLKDACIEFMLSSNRMDDVVASQGYVNLKRSSPCVIVDAFERAAKSRKLS